MQPGNIEDALNEGDENCVLHPEMCKERIRQIESNVDRHWNSVDKDGNQVTPKAIPGNLVWKNGLFGGDVEFVPQSNGRWHISQQPIRPNYKTITSKGVMPGNMDIYRMGCDPYDSDETLEKGSDGAFIVKRRKNLSEEKGLVFDDNGNILNP